MPVTLTLPMPTSPIAGVVIKHDTLGRLRISRETRETLLNEFERASMSGAAFAKWAGIKASTMGDWIQKRRRQRKIDSRKKAQWVEAVVPAAVVGGFEVMIHLSNGIRVEARHGKSAAEFLKIHGGGAC